jgi:hypothetical protein
VTSCSSTAHEHRLDYILVFFEGDQITLFPEPDSAGEFNDQLDFAPPLGKAVYVRGGGIETAVNTGTERYREILIEIKDT